MPARVEPETSTTGAMSVRQAARWLYGLATVIFLLATALALAAIVAGVVLLDQASKNGHSLWPGVIVIGVGIVSWLWAALPCFAAQAVARYIEWRTED